MAEGVGSVFRKEALWTKKFSRLRPAQSRQGAGPLRFPIDVQVLTKLCWTFISGVRRLGWQSLIMRHFHAVWDDMFESVMLCLS